MKPIIRFLNFFSFLTLCLLWLQSAHAQTTVTITANTAAGVHSTGSVRSNGTKYDGNLTTLSTSSTNRRGWAVFDLSSIPAGSIINSANVIFTTYSSSSSTATNRIRGFVGDPNTMAGTTLFNTINTGVELNASSWTASGTQTKAVSATGLNFLQTNFGGTIVLGFIRGSTNVYNVYGYPGTAAQRPKLEITYTLVNPCSGTPNAGVINGPTDICPGKSFTLSLTGHTSPVSNSGLVFQWQKKAVSSGTWTNFGSNSTSVSTSITTASDFRCIVTCNNSTQKDTTTVHTILVNSFYECYCNTGLGGSTTAVIDSVSIPGTTLNHIAPGASSPYYTLAPIAGSTTGQLTIGGMYKIYVKYSTDAKGSAWLDANRNGTYENSEWVQINTSGTLGMSYIHVPTNAQSGLTGLRVRSSASSATNGASNDCSSISSGETIDYVVELIPGPVNDVQALKILSPVDGSSFCSTPLVPVEVEIYNSGSVPQSNFGVHAFYNGPIMSVMSTTYNGTLAPYTRDTVTLGNFNPITGGNYSMAALTTLNNDVNQYNDTSYYSFFEMYPIPPMPIVSSDTVCPGEGAVLRIVPDTPGFTHKWYDASAGGNLLHTGDTLLLSGLTADSTFYVTTAGAGKSDNIASANNGSTTCGGGVMFNVTPNSNMYLDSFLVRSATAGTQTVNVYYKVGTFSGFQTNAGAWTLVGSASVSFPSAGGYGMVNVGTPISVPANTMYAVYINYNARYSSGASVYNNADLTMETGSGLCGQFASSNTPRTFNGTVYYHIGDGCETQRVPVSAIIAAPPVVDLGPDTTLCENDNTVLNAGNLGATYLWSTGDKSQTIKLPKVSGQYWVEVDKYCKVSDTVNLIIDPLPAATGISYIRNGNSYTFSPAGDIHAEAYTWIFGDGNSDTGRVVNHTYAIYNPYNVKLILTNSCGNDTVSLQIPTGISAVASGEDEVKLYPNPANGYIKVESTKFMKHLSVYDMTGRNVLEQKESNKEAILDVSMLPAGTYIIKISTEAGVTSRSFRILR